MTSSLSSAVSSSSAAATLSILIDGAHPLQAFCRPPPPGSHLVRPAGHLQHAVSSVATGACPGSVEAAILASAAGFAGGAAFIGGFVGGAAGPVAPPTGDGSAFYSPPHMDSAIDAWHHPVAAAAAAAAAAVGMTGGGGGGMMGSGAGWAFDPCRPIAAGYTTYGSVSYGLDVRRKNATRESTSTLKAWLFDHIKNPYPTKGEKIMLAIITKMTLTQVSTWFANARRRLKKENKMQWPPRQRPNDDDDDDDDEEDRNSLSDENDDVIDGEKDGGDRSQRHLAPSPVRSEEDDVIVDTDFEDDHQAPICSFSSPNHPILSPSLSHSPTTRDDPHHDDPALRHGCPDRASSSPRPSSATQGVRSPHNDPQSPLGSPDRGVDDHHVPKSSNHESERTHEETQEVKVKPRIWSLVDTATSGVVRSPPEAVGRDVFPVQTGSFHSGSFQPWITISNGFHSSACSVVHPGLFARTGSHVTALRSPRTGAPQRAPPQTTTTQHNQQPMIVAAAFNKGTTSAYPTGLNGLKRATPVIMGERSNTMEPSAAATPQTNRAVDV